jgi:hypothetical protein
MAKKRRTAYKCKLCGKPVPPEEIRWYANKKGGKKYPKIYHLECAREIGRRRHRTRYSKTGTTRVLRADRETFAAEGKKWCGQCQTARPLNDFSDCATSSDGKMGWCRFCTARLSKKRRHERLGVPKRVHVSLEDRVSYAEQGLKYCPGCQRAHPYEEFRNSPTAKLPHRGLCRACAAAKLLGNGITGPAIRAKREANDGTCEVCFARGVLVIDHDHLRFGNASLRGVICRSPCNLVLGYMQDSPPLLEKLAKYIHTHQKFVQRSKAQSPSSVRVGQNKRRLNRSEHEELRAAGRKWCPDCQSHYPIEEFSGARKPASVCRMCLSARKKGPGVTGQAVRRMWEARGSQCNVCGRTEKLRLDHDHRIMGDKSLRGVLCIHCNSALGRLKDSVTHIRLLRNYLLSWKSPSRSS